MKQDFTNLLATDFIPLSETKAKLSEQIRKVVTEAKRVAITTNGKPTAVLMSYSDFLELIKSRNPPSQELPSRKINYRKWKTNEPKRADIRDSIFGLFDMTKLSHKGQKKYKKNLVHEYRTETKKRSRKGRSI